MPSALEAETKKSRPDRRPLFFVGLAGFAFALFAFEAKSGHSVHWWNWVIPSLVIVNTAVASLLALRARPRLSTAISRISLALALFVIVAILAQTQG